MDNLQPLARQKRIKELVKDKESSKSRSRSPAVHSSGSETLLTNLELWALASGDEELADYWAEEGVVKLEPASAAARGRRRGELSL